MEEIVAVESKVLRLVLVIVESEMSLWSNARDHRGRMEGSPTRPRQRCVREIVTAKWKISPRLNL